MAFTYYNPNLVAHRSNFHLPGIERFSYIFKLFGATTMAAVDRTDTLRFPVKLKNISPIPALRPFNRSYEDICNERARELIERANKMDVSIYVLWSGGIDSTLLLVSLLKNANDVEKERIVVLLSEESIMEYPKFYHEHIRGKLRKEPSAAFPYIVGTKHLFVSGELNDQIMGAAVPHGLMGMYGDDIIHRPRTRDIIFEFYNRKAQNPEITNRYLDLFDRVVAASPVTLHTYFDYFWWINFTMKWQLAYLRILTFTVPRNISALTPEYLATRYVSFYDTDDFQLWSMLNLDMKVKDTWPTYKWVCKDIIYDYTHDADYRDTKIKRGSLVSIMRQQSPYNFIDESWRFSRDVPVADYYEPKNDLV
jgi:hypothetical protein